MSVKTAKQYSATVGKAPEKKADPVVVEEKKEEVVVPEKKVGKTFLYLPGRDFEKCTIRSKGREIVARYGVVVSGILSDDEMEALGFVVEKTETVSIETKKIVRMFHPDMSLDGRGPNGFVMVGDEKVDLVDGVATVSGETAGKLKALGYSTGRSVEGEIQ